MMACELLGHSCSSKPSRAVKMAAMQLDRSRRRVSCWATHARASHQGLSRWLPCNWIAHDGLLAVGPFMLEQAIKGCQDGCHAIGKHRTPHRLLVQVSQSLTQGLPCITPTGVG
eukprot:TRINITY_DN12076_c0_g1_i9.p1 TRINITY_DN12076_c0_g1~~TRINITY_DN12076_c0_g1_i9.p1  ORF type:complete len:114 (+),score=14.54 TRINITY_DN12076_c0_g1_i9:228-569(+)